MVNMNGDQFKGEIIKGESLFLNTRIHEALEVFESVLEKDPENAEALNNIGVVLNGMGRFEEAIDICSNLIKMDPTHSNAIFNLISNYLSLSNWEAAERALSTLCHHLPPEDAQALARKIACLRFSSSESPFLKSIPLTINNQGGTYSLHLLLDISKYSQEIIWNHLKNNNIYEGETLRFISEILKPGDCFVDVGAHIGYFSLFASRFVGAGGQVIAVEPEISNTAHLMIHMSINGIENIDLINKAAGAEDTEAELFVNSDNDGGHALWNPGLHPYNERTRAKGIVRKVKLATLDSILERHEIESVKVVKIDTEGAELEVLKGASKYLSEKRMRNIICEINRFGLNKMGTSEKELRDHMYDLGYETYIMQDQDPGIVKLDREQYIQSPYVFNLLFRQPQSSLY